MTWHPVGQDIKSRGQVLGFFFINSHLSVRYGLVGFYLCILCDNAKFSGLISQLIVEKDIATFLFQGERGTCPRQKSNRAMRRRGEVEAETRTTTTTTHLILVPQLTTFALTSPFRNRYRVSHSPGPVSWFIRVDWTGIMLHGGPKWLKENWI